MRFMILVKASKESEAGMMPSKEMLTKMGEFNEELAKEVQTKNRNETIEKFRNAQ